MDRWVEAAGDIKLKNELMPLPNRWGRGGQYCSADINFKNKLMLPERMMDTAGYTCNI